MKRLSVDRAGPAVKKFIRSLAKDANGVELTLGGNVVCRVIPPTQLSDTEKAWSAHGLARGTEQFETLQFEAVNPTFLLWVGKAASANV